MYNVKSTTGPGSSVGIATGYGLDGPGSNSGGDEIFCTCPDWSWGPPCLLYNGGRKWPGHDTDPSPPFKFRGLKTGYSYTSTLPNGLCGL
jgi:hypothetical protein